MFVFQNMVFGSAPAKKERESDKFSNALVNKETRQLLARSGIDASKPAADVALAIAQLMRQEQKLPEAQRTFTHEWQRLTGLSQQSMELVLTEYRRLGLLPGANLASQSRRTAQNAAQAGQEVQKDAKYASDLTEELKKVIPRKVRRNEFYQPPAA